MMSPPIRGHAAVLELLDRARAQDRVAHSYAFVGPSGVGKKLTAVAFAQTLLCPSRPLTPPSPRGGEGSLLGPSPFTGEGRSVNSSPPRGGEEKGEGVGLGGCGTCSSCRRVAAGTHPDCRLISPDGLTIKIEQIRELEWLAALKPHDGARKIFIVDEAERMPPVSANALLKTLEEPPDRTVLILILAQAKALPPTVISRCQIVRFAPLAEDEAVAVLRAHGVDEATARFLARACQGRVGLALARGAAAWREQRDGAVALLDKIGAEGIDSLFSSAEAVGRDRGQAADLIEAVWLWQRDLLCVKAGGDPRLLISSDRQGDLALAASRTSWERAIEALVACRQAWQAIQGNVSPRLTLEVLLGRLALGVA